MFKVYSGKDKKTELSEWNPDSQNGAYEIAYGENTDAGSGYVILNGKGKYGGSKTIKFTILPKWLQWLFG
ncbi:MAG: hypothetical protein K6E16_04010 [Lachnospiraceae bacterium]|nr:hypothetical protein [Lachnospiraceae bacterium]